MQLWQTCKRYRPFWHGCTPVIRTKNARKAETREISSSFINSKLLKIEFCTRSNFKVAILCQEYHQDVIVSLQCCHRCSDHIAQQKYHAIHLLKHSNVHTTSFRVAKF